MKYTLEKFKQNNVRLESRITITRSNSIGFPTKFSEDNRIKEYKYVVLYYDKVARAIGIQFINDDTEPYKFTLIKSEKFGASVIAQSFFKANNIDTNVYHGRYNWTNVEIEEDKKVFVIELDNKKLNNN